MKILVTGANGFIGKNLCARLVCTTDHEILMATRETTEEELIQYLKDCDFIYHLAGVNRPKGTDGYAFNGEYTAKIINYLQMFNRSTPIVFTSSTQARNQNEYGISKAVAENLLMEYRDEANAPVYIYRLANVFGKWCKPNYNSVIATFCHNIANGIKINVCEDKELTLMYIDDVVDEFVRLLDSKVYEQGYIPVYKARVSHIATKLMGISELQQSIYLDTMVCNLDKYLYATYLSYLPLNKLLGQTKCIGDKRGSFTELIRGRGQVSVNIIYPKQEKGGHWHDTKTERFYVVRGEVNVMLHDKGLVHLKEGMYLDVPCGSVHTIMNKTEEEAIIIIWCNEYYSEKRPDTMVWR